MYRLFIVVFLLTSKSIDFLLKALNVNNLYTFIENKTHGNPIQVPELQSV